jgi:hypothetical protein
MPDNELPFEDLSPEEDEELSPEELEVLARIENGENEIVPDEWFIERFIEHFGHEPKIKEWNAFTFYVLSDFDEEWRDEAIEVKFERP